MINSFENITVVEFPKLEDVTFIQIEKKYLNVILINLCALFAICYAIVFILNYNNILNELPFSISWLYFGITSVFVICFASYSIGFKQRQFAVRQKDISYKKGILFKRITTVPFNRVQHVEIDQGPIARFFGLVTLSVFTAGDSSDDLKIKGLKENKAKEIKEFISTKIDD